MALSGLTPAGANGGNYAAVTPDNYRDVFGFDNAPDSTNLPQIYEREVTIYGNRTLMGFLRTIGSEMATQSQQIRWVEQRRLHVFYDDATAVSATVLSFPTQTNGAHSVRLNDKILVSKGDAAADLYIVTAKDASSHNITIQAYSSTPTNTIAASDTVKVLVIGTEFGKGSDSRGETLQAEYDTYTNSTVIQRDTFSINGTDANQIGWVEIVDENGAQGKYWYLKGKSETMLRWEDYMETSLLEDQIKDTASDVGKAEAGSELGYSKNGTPSGYNGGSEGLFEAIATRGNQTTGGFATGAGSGANAFLGDIDSIIEVLDTEGNIEENLFYLNRQESLNFDDGMAVQNNGTGGTSTSWGLFNNSEKMALNFGFVGLRRGSYDFYKKDWKYLNAVDGRGSFGGVKGVSIPMGTKSVYDQYGANLQAPFASIHYLAGPTQNRKNISWAHGGSFGGGYNGLDSMNVEMLSEKCICLKGANNFILFS